MSQYDDQRIAQAVEAALPRSRTSGDWEAVTREARKRRSRRIRAGSGSAVTLAVVATALVALASPFAGGERAGVLDRALAAVGDGPVIHVVREGSWGGDLVDLGTGERSRMRGVSETWYAPSRNLVRSVVRLGSVVQSDETFRPGRRADDLAALGVRYREALRAGTARVFGEGRVEGRPVLWIVVHKEDLPDVADGANHTWTQQIAISAATFEPVATRETRDGEEGPGTRQLVRTLEYVSSEAADFGAVEDGARPRPGMYFKPGLTGPSLSLPQARAILGPAPVWLGRSFRQIPLAHIGEEEMGVYDPATKARSGSHGVVFVYGNLADATEADPRFDGDYVTVRETTTPPSEFSMGNEYFPPEGKAFVAAKSALVRRDGVYVRIEASSAPLALDAARALSAIP